VGAAQRYVSNELSHFVGSGKADPAEQYDILVKVLKTGWLTHSPEGHRGASLQLGKPISSDEFIQYRVVCFCDIPEPDLAIHVQKYSKFGLAFKKDFLTDQGACPVFYVAKEGPIANPKINMVSDQLVDRVKAALAKQDQPKPRQAAIEGILDRALYFDMSVEIVCDVLYALDAFCNEENQRQFRGLPIERVKRRLGQFFSLSGAQIDLLETGLKGNAQAANASRMITEFLMHHIFSFIKCFDAQLVPDDQRNYYMEREWRIAGNLSFNLNDVHRVFLPSGYAKKFRNDLPAYSAQLSFVD
jgi:hypothetical protein